MDNKALNRASCVLLCEENNSNNGGGSFDDT